MNIGDIKNETTLCLYDDSAEGLRAMNEVKKWFMLMSRGYTIMNTTTSTSFGTKSIGEPHITFMLWRHGVLIDFKSYDTVISICTKPITSDLLTITHMDPEDFTDDTVTRNRTRNPIRELLLRKGKFRIKIYNPYKDLIIKSKMII